MAERVRRKRVARRWRLSRSERWAVVVVMICVVALGGCGSNNPALPVSPQASVSGGGPRTCASQRLACEQLVALGLNYPYPRQQSSYLFVNGIAYPYLTLGHQSLADASVRAGDAVLSARDLLGRLGLGSQADVARTPVIAYGANANVDALTRKFVTSDFSGPVVIPVVEGTLRDFDVTWSPHLAFNGAMPATIIPSPGTTVSVWITWVDNAELARLNATEGVGSLYSYGFLSRPRLDAPGPTMSQPSVYVDCYGALRVGGHILAVGGVPARHRRFATANSPEALSQVAPLFGWHGSVFNLVLDNVNSPERSASRTRSLAALGVRPSEPGYTATSPCSQG